MIFSIGGLKNKIQYHIFNNSPQEDLSDLQEYKAIIYSVGRNVGYGSAINYVANIVKEDFVVINPDIQVTREVLYYLHDIIIRENNIGIIGIQLYNSDGVERDCYFNYPDIKSLFQEFILFHKISYMTQNSKLLYFGKEQFLEVEVVKGAFLFVKYEVFNSLRGFDENIFLYSEESDLCRRIQAAGYKVLYSNQKNAFHSGFSSIISKQDAITAKIYYFRSKIYYYRKYYGMKGKIIAILILYLSLIIRIVAFCLIKPKLSFDYIKVLYNL